MTLSELKDHAIAHNIQQKQVEGTIITRVAEIEAFFEEEKLENAGAARAPLLDKHDLLELPISKFEVTERHDDEDVFFKCTVCQQDFEDEEEVRTLRCLHMFHRKCIDEWLTTVAGACVNCKVV
jgi:hypothetical protein